MPGLDASVEVVRDERGVPHIYADTPRDLFRGQGYVAAQERVSQAWVDYERWTRMAILNVARSGRFSSDRTIREYAEDIWDVGPIPIE